jgi:hypothetical protein
VIATASATARPASTTGAGYLPAQPMIDAATRALQHPAGPPALPGHDLLVLAAWAVAGLVASLVWFRWEPSRPAHRPPARRAPRAVWRHDRHDAGGGFPRRRRRRAAAPANW